MRWSPGSKERSTLPLPSPRQQRIRPGPRREKPTGSGRGGGKGGGRAATGSRTPVPSAGGQGPGPMASTPGTRSPGTGARSLHPLQPPCSRTSHRTGVPESGSMRSWCPCARAAQSPNPQRLQGGNGGGSGLLKGTPLGRPGTGTRRCRNSSRDRGIDGGGWPAPRPGGPRRGESGVEAHRSWEPPAVRFGARGSHRANHTQGTCTPVQTIHDSGSRGRGPLWRVPMPPPSSTQSPSRASLIMTAGFSTGPADGLLPGNLPVSGWVTRRALRNPYPGAEPAPTPAAPPRWSDPRLERRTD